MLTILAAVVLISSFVFLTLIEPKKSEKTQYSKFAGRYYAHRGLHTEDKSIPENSIPAFVAASEKGYGIELDVRLASDGTVVVFHDNSLKRVCGIDKCVSDLSYKELSALTLHGTNYTIPRLTDVLGAVSKKTPLIVELKSNGDDYKKLCENVWSILSGYDGIYCIESFDPRAVGWFKKYHANVYRGQLVASFADLKKGASGNLAFFVSYGLSNIIARPHFIAHKLEKKTFPILVCEWLGARKIAWVSRDEKDHLSLESDNDGIIFEYYEPKARYYKEL